ncbi:MAG: hypothetical protein NTY90_04945 [Candidatus Micrarchaeota archaeon]|nr:hypothetical protein [Candidatus Micrarchaeota archaeon]
MPSIGQERRLLEKELEKASEHDRRQRTGVVTVPKPYLPQILAEMKRGHKVVAIGAGEEKEVLKRTGARVINVDEVETPRADIVKPAAAEQLSRILPKTHLPADHVVALNVLDIAYNPIEICRQAFKTLKPGGTLWVGTPFGWYGAGHGAYYAIGDKFKHARELFAERGLLQVEEGGLDKFSFDADYVKHLLTKAGFRPENVQLVSRHEGISFKNMAAVFGLIKAVKHRE